MAFKFKELSEIEWETALLNFNAKSVFGNISYLASFENVFGVKKRLLAVEENDTIKLLIAVFEKGREIICPHHYFFQFLWEAESEGSWKRIHVLDFLLKNLNKRYRKIKLRLPYTFNDSRIFDWNNYDVKLKYTYHKTIPEISSHQNIKRILSKSAITFTYSTNSDIDQVLAKHASDLKSLKFDISFVDSAIAHFRIMLAQGVAVSYDICQDYKLLGSVIAILDKDQKTAYFPLISKFGKDKGAASVCMYQYALSELSKDGYKNVDLFGANIYQIAAFKNKFSSTLVPFFEVKFNVNKYVFRRILENVKSAIKSMLR